ncbi:MAG: hypothetical protein PHE49_11630 [bacterium]|nr:hypothetical protein [bacterium]
MIIAEKNSKIMGICDNLEFVPLGALLQVIQRENLRPKKKFNG